MELGPVVIIGRPGRGVGGDDIAPHRSRPNPAHSRQCRAKVRIFGAIPAAKPQRFARADVIGPVAVVLNIHAPPVVDRARRFALAVASQLARQGADRRVAGFDETLRAEPSARKGDRFAMGSLRSARLAAILTSRVAKGASCGRCTAMMLCPNWSNDNSCRQRHISASALRRSCRRRCVGAQSDWPAQCRASAGDHRRRSSRVTMKQWVHMHRGLGEPQCALAGARSPIRDLMNSRVAPAKPSKPS